MDTPGFESTVNPTPEILFKKKKSKKEKPSENSSKDASSAANGEKKDKLKKKKKTKDSRLSFHGDDEDDGGKAFKIKKKKKDAVQELQESRMRARMKREARKAKKTREKQVQSYVGTKPEPPKEPKVTVPRKGSAPAKMYAPMMSGSGEYTPEKINLLKSNAIHLRTNSNSRSRLAGQSGKKKSKALSQQYDTEISADPLAPDSPPHNPTIDSHPSSDPEEIKARLQAEVAKISETINPKLKSAEDDDDQDNASRLLAPSVPKKQVQQQQPQRPLGKGEARRTVSKASVDKTTVAEARKQRSRMRAIGAAAEYIPLRQGAEPSETLISGKYGLKEGVGANKHGTLMVEEGSDEEPDFTGTSMDASGRIRFAGGAPKKKGLGSLLDRRKEGPGSDEELGIGVGEEDDDDEIRRWEDQQIKMSGAAKMLQKQAKEQNALEQASKEAAAIREQRRSMGGGFASSYQLPTPNSSPSSTSALPPTTFSNYTLTPTGLAVSDYAIQSDATVESIKTALQKSLEQMKIEHTKKETILDSMKKEILSTSTQIDLVEKKMETANSQYVFFQKVRDEVSDILACLNEKQPTIEEALTLLQEIRKAKAKKRAEIEALHLDDLKEEAFGEEPQSKKEKETEKEQKPLDEFGRDLGYVAEQGKDKRAKMRQTRLQRHRLRKEKLKKSEEEDDFIPDGWSTDSDEELGPEFNNQMTELLTQSQAIFQDASEEFASFDHIQSVLENWKKTYPDSYGEAYISLSVPSLFAPYIRLQLLTWNPLRHESFTTSFDWYKRLFSYGMDSNTSPDDPDFHLVPKLVEKLVVPQLVEWLLYEWDPLSTTSFSKTYGVVKETVLHLGDDEKQQPAIQSVLGAIMSRYKKTINNHVRWPIVPSTAAASPQNKRTSEKKVTGSGPGSGLGSRFELQFTRRRVWRAVKLLEMICKWKDLLNKQQLQDLASSHLVDSILPLFSHQVEWLCAPLNEKFGDTEKSKDVEKGRKRKKERVKVEDSEEEYLSRLNELQEEVKKMCLKLTRIIPEEWVKDKTDSAIGQLRTLMTEYVKHVKEGERLQRRIRVSGPGVVSETDVTTTKAKQQAVLIKMRTLIRS